MRIPNVNKTYTVFEGCPPPPTRSVPLIYFYVGEDLIIEAPLFIEDRPVLPDKWALTATLSESSFSAVPCWTGKLNEGIYHEAAKPSIYRVVVPAKVTETTGPGTYWLDISAKELIGAGNDILDKSLILARIPIGVNFAGVSKKAEDPSPPPFNITQV